MTAIYSHLCFRNQSKAAGLYMTAMVYALPARPIWSPLLNMATFLGTALLPVGLVLGVVALGGTGILSKADPAAGKAMGLAVSNWLYWARLLVGLLLPAGAGAAAALVARTKDVSTRYAAIALAAALLGELAGRAVFYASALSTSLWG